MSIQRYHFYNIYGTPIPDNKVIDGNGDYVLYTDHLTDKQSALDAQQAAHTAEVERLTGNYDQCKSRLDDMISEVERLKDALHAVKGDRDGFMSALEKISSERDAAVRERDVALEALRQLKERAEQGRDAAIIRAKAAEFTARTFSVACDAHKRRAERAESCLRSIKAITDSTRIDMTRPTRALTRIEELAYAVLSSPPADASKIGGERERRLVEALRHVCKHLCQWNDACETGCIVSAALAEMEQKS